VADGLGRPPVGADRVRIGVAELQHRREGVEPVGDLSVVHYLAPALAPARGHPNLGARTGRYRRSLPSVRILPRTRLPCSWGNNRSQDDNRRPPARDGRRRAQAALEAVPRRLGTRLLFPAPRGGYMGLDTWRSREWYPALEAAGLKQRGPYCLRHTFATEALAAGISTFELARLKGSSVQMIELTYGHLARDSEGQIRARLDARARQMGVRR